MYSLKKVEQLVSPPLAPGFLASDRIMCTCELRFLSEFVKKKKTFLSGAVFSVPRGSVTSGLNLAFFYIRQRFW